MYNDAGKRISLKKDQSLGMDSWEMRCPDSSYKSCLLCAGCSDSSLHFSKIPLKLADFLADRYCNIYLRRSQMCELDTHRRCQLLQFRDESRFWIPRVVTATSPNQIPCGNKHFFFFHLQYKRPTHDKLRSCIAMQFPFENPILPRQKYNEMRQRNPRKQFAIAGASGLQPGSELG